MQAILITGGAGFIGSNFIPYFLERHNEYRIINLDKITYAGSLENLEEVTGHPRYEFIKGDINNRELVAYILERYDIRGVIHFAAETHVDNSINGPQEFITTNVNGTFTLLDSVRRHWMAAPFQYKPGYEGCRFHHISTDEVYGSLGSHGMFTEQSAYAPRSPYSASKAGADMIVKSYWYTYGMNVIISNCSNNYGPKQHPEKFIPTIIRKALSGETIPVYGNGLNIRDWIYVMDHCQGIDAIYHRGRAGESYNIGGRNEQENLTIALIITSLMDRMVPENLQRYGLKSYRDLIGFVPDRPGHDWRYALDTHKIEQETGWRAARDFSSGIEKTVAWYMPKFIIT